MAPFSEDALNRYRITHPYDRDLRPLFKRLHRLPHLANTPGEDGEPISAEDLEREKEMAKMEVIKWKMTVERILASVRNLHRQQTSYESRADDTARRTAEMTVALEQEKQSLVAKRTERDRMIKCDEIAGRITARGKTRAELEEQIADIQQSLADHRSSHALYLETVQARIDTFSRISALVEESRGLKLPLEPQATIPDELKEDSAAMEVDETGAASSSTKLSAAALPFQPTSSEAASPIGAGGSGALSSAATMRPPPASHGVPTRPKVTTSASASGAALTGRMTRVSSSTLPSKPSALRSSTTAGVLHSSGSLEDGELDTAEDGEVAEARTTRSSAASRRA